MRYVLARAIRGYQFLLSPWFGNQCRFYPTCSEYARLAIIEHGSFRGSWLALRRTLKCHPWHAGGIDWVPHRCKSTGAGKASPANTMPAATDNK
ncbi:MAG: membrane protein insertion efficiency factor YidD [Betaproteobacteria bacterium]|jgi:putative membrane protein insertion efficiency factor|nr:MAG: membrane protein insertion efficiency factor YidD [Betaproteobacteria bacterium]